VFSYNYLTSTNR